MRNAKIFRKFLSVALALALVLGSLCQSGITEAKEKHRFVYLSEPGGYSDVICMNLLDGDDIEYFNTLNEYFNTLKINQGKKLCVGIQLPHSSKIINTSIVSSDSRVLKVVDEKQGKIKAVKKGNAKLKVAVTWRHTGKNDTIHIPVAKKCGKKDKYAKKCGLEYRIHPKKIKLKKGKTYSFKFSIPFKVICKAGTHKFSKPKTTRKATCSQSGEKMRVCKKCGYQEYKYLNSLPHKYGDWKVTTPATCTEYGEKTRVCSVCKGKETEEIDILPHQYDSETGRCSVCGKSKYEDDDDEDEYDEDEDEI